MTFELRDVIYFILFVSTFGGLWFRIGKGWGEIDAVKESVKTVKNVLFKGNGELSLITAEQCRERQAVLQRQQDRSDAAYQRIESELRELSNNVLIIMVHLNIDVDDAKRRGAKNG